MKENAKEAILTAAREAAMVLRLWRHKTSADLAQTVGIKAASATTISPTRPRSAGGRLRSAIGEDIARDLDAISVAAQSLIAALRSYPDIFRASLERDNRIRLSSFMATEY